MKKRLFYLCALLWASALSAEIAEITPAEAYQRQKQGAVVIDVRTPEEFMYTGHAPGHINIPFYFLHFEMLDVDKRLQLSTVESKFNRPMTPTSTYKQQHVPNSDMVIEILKVAGEDKNREIILICKSGERSKVAAHMLEESGFKHIYSVQGGFEGHSNKKEFNCHNLDGWKNSEGLPWGL